MCLITMCYASNIGRILYAWLMLFNVTCPIVTVLFPSLHGTYSSTALHVYGPLWIFLDVYVVSGYILPSSIRL